MGTLNQFHDILARMGSDVLFHRELGGSACPCRSAEGFRDPGYHREHPEAPLCNETGFLVEPVEFYVKAAVQPVRMRYNRNAQRTSDLLGDVQADDRIGIFPCVWGGHVLDFNDWSEAGDEYVLYDGARYMAVSYDKVPDTDGMPSHHWEVGLRLLKTDRPTDGS